jgi:hypothetical protein
LGAQAERERERQPFIGMLGNPAKFSANILRFRVRSRLARSRPGTTV